jgi:transcriptional regulator with XRE-family HTH domain
VEIERRGNSSRLQVRVAENNNKREHPAMKRAKPVVDGVNFKLLREQYCLLWRALLERRRLGQRIDETQGAIAEKVGLDAATISRLVSGRTLPRSLDTLIRVAEYIGAKQRETKVLMIWASALIAFDSGEKRAAEELATVFHPLFDEEAFGSKLISVPSVVENVLVHLGVPGDVAAEISRGVADDPAEAARVLYLSDEPAIERVMKGVKRDDLKDIQKTYSQIAIANFREQPAIRKLLRSGVEIGLWRRVPNLTVTRIRLKADEVVTDSPHDGYEFLLLMRGSGSFTMSGLSPVALSEEGRQLIAYRPNGVHSFAAARDGARLFVMSYVRPQDVTNPENDVVADARREVEALRRRAT